MFGLVLVIHQQWSVTWMSLRYVFWPTHPLSQLPATVHRQLKGPELCLETHFAAKFLPSIFSLTWLT